MTFDPYHKWLGIPRHEQPPDHYRLLGISQYEADPDVIDAAANRQMAYVQGFSNGEHTAASQRILNELATARICLLDTAARTAYDDRLRQAIPPGRREGVEATAITRGPAIEHAGTSSSGSPSGGERRRSSTSKRSNGPGRLRNQGSEGLISEPLDTAPSPLARVQTPAAEGRPRNMLVVGTAVITTITFLGVLGWRAWPHTASMTAGTGERHPEPAVPTAIEMPEPITSNQPPAAARPQATSEPTWEPPSVGDFPASSFVSLFHNRTIDGPLVNTSNCWLEKQYTDFVLRFEYRLKSHERNPWNGVRLRHGGSRRLSLVLAKGISGGILLDRSIPDLEKPLVEEILDPTHRMVRPARNAEGNFGDWNRCEVVCQGSRTVVSINGVVVNHIPNGPTGTGMICLSGFESGVAFRDIKAMSLDPSTK